MNRDDLAFAGVVKQAELVRAGEVSSRELVELYLDRIGRLEPELNAFRTVMAERALADAEQAESRRRAGDERPLLGVPIAPPTPGLRASWPASPKRFSAWLDRSACSVAPAASHAWAG